MSRFIERVCRAVTGPKRHPTRPAAQLALESLEQRLTPAIFMQFPSAIEGESLPMPAAAGVEVVDFALTGTLHLKSGDAEKTASFMIDDKATLNVSPSAGENSPAFIKFNFDEPLVLTFAGSKEYVDAKGHAEARLQFEEGAEHISVKFWDMAKIKLEGAAAEGDLTLQGSVADKRGDATLLSVSFDDAAGTTMSNNGVACVAGSHYKFEGSVASVKMDEATNLRIHLPGIESVDHKHKGEIELVAAVSKANAPSLALDAVESLSLNFATLHIEYKDQSALSGEVTHMEYKDLVSIKEGSTAVVTNHLNVQATGDMTSWKSLADITIDPSEDLASYKQDIAAAGSAMTIKLTDTVVLRVDDFDMTSHKQLTETGSEISIELQSLLGKPPPGNGG
jgi:hypothetical protein